MLKRNLLLSIFAIAGLLIGATASAQDKYVGLTVGQSKWSDDCKGLTKCDTTPSAYKMMGGYQLDKNFAIEASLFSLGRINAMAPVGNTTASAEVKGGGVELAGVVRYELTHEFAGFAKLGLARVTTSVHSSVMNILNLSRDTTSTQPVLGLGMSYQLSKEIALSAEFEKRRVKLDNEKESVSNFSVGLRYGF